MFPIILKIIANCYLSFAFLKFEIVEQNIKLICNHYIFQNGILFQNLGPYLESLQPSFIHPAFIHRRISIE
jgi:hypothetical protein